MFSHKISEPKMSKNQPSDRILEHFQYRSESFWPVRLFGIIYFFREGRNPRIIGKNKLAKFQIWGPNDNIIILLGAL